MLPFTSLPTSAPPCTLVLQLLKALWCCIVWLLREVRACLAALSHMRSRHYLLKHAALPFLPDKVGVAITDSVPLGTSVGIVK